MSVLRRLSFALPLVLVVSALPAQRVDAVQVGDRIRFRQLDWPDAPRLRGTVVERTRDSVHVAVGDEGSVAAFALPRLVEVERAQAFDTRRASVRRWAIGGALSGLAVFVGGAISGNCLGLSSSADPGCWPTASGVAGSALAGVVLGSIVGSAYGAVRPIERWVPLNAARSVRLGVGPTPAGVGLRVSAGF